MSAVKTIGIIGGGQLGLMIIEQAHLLGARTICLDPAEDAPAFKISDERIVGRFDDPAALEELCRRSDVVTYEFENVPGDLLVALEQKYNIKQGFRPLFDSQDRLREKSNACDHGLKTPAFMAVDDEESLHRAIARIGYPCVLKTRTLGYDGHGQAVLRGEADLAKARELLAVPCILEEFVPFDFEASVVLVSWTSVQVWPPCVVLKALPAGRTRCGSGWCPRASVSCATAVTGGFWLSNIS